jgi:hypothetical protein
VISHLEVYWLSLDDLSRSGKTSLLVTLPWALPSVAVRVLLEHQTLLVTDLAR